MSKTTKKVENLVDEKGLIDVEEIKVVTLNIETLEKEEKEEEKEEEEEEGEFNLAETENEKLLREKEKTFEVSRVKVDKMIKDKLVYKLIRKEMDIRNKIEKEIFSLRDKIERGKNGKPASNGRYTRVDGITNAISDLNFSFKSDLSDLINKADQLFINARTGNESNKVLVKRWVVMILPTLINLGFAVEKDGIVTVTRINPGN